MPISSYESLPLIPFHLLPAQRWAVCQILWSEKQRLASALGQLTSACICDFDKSILFSRVMERAWGSQEVSVAQPAWSGGKWSEEGWYSAVASKKKMVSGLCNLPGQKPALDFFFPSSYFDSGIVIVLRPKFPAGNPPLSNCYLTLQLPSFPPTVDNQSWLHPKTSLAPATPWVSTGCLRCIC